VATDPYSLVYKKLWEMFESHRGFTGLVRVSNRGKFLAWRRGVVEQLAALTEDRPFVTIIPSGGDPHAHATSSGSHDVERYRIVVVTGSAALNEQLYPINWEIYRGALLWTSTLKALTYGGASLVHKAVLTDRTTTVVGGENQGIRGWVGSHGYEIHMHWQTSAIRPT